MLMALGALAGGFGSLLGMRGNRKAAEQRVAAARATGDVILKEGQEQERRLGEQIRRREAATSAMSAASGVQSTGSRKAFIDKAKTENRAQLNWLNYSTRLRARAAKMGGNIQASQLNTQANMMGLQGVASILTGISRL